MAENNKFIAVAITLTISVILIGSMLVPVIDDYSDSTDTVFNRGIGGNKLTVVDNPDFKDPITVSVDTVTHELTYPDGTKTTYHAYNSMLFVSDLGGVGINNVDAGEYYNTVNTVKFNKETTTAVSVSILGNDITMTVTGDPAYPEPVVISNCSWIAYPDANGNYTMGQTGVVPKEFWVNGIGQLYGFTYLKSLGDKFISFHGADATYYGDSEPKHYEMFLDVKKVDGYDNVYHADSMAAYTISETIGHNSDGSPFSPYRYLIPVSVIGTTEETAQQLQLLNVLPVLLVASLLVIAVGALVTRRS